MRSGSIKYFFGYCEYAFEEDYVHIYNLFVYPEFRRQGKARDILQSAINRIRETGYMDEIQIVANPNKDCEISLEKLIEFYENIGLKVFEYYG